MTQKMRRRSKKTAATKGGRFFVPAVLTLSGLTAAFAVTLAAGLTWPAIPFPLGLATHHEKRADLALNQGAKAADLERAALENDQTLAASPTIASAWLRAAYIRQQQSGSLDSVSLRYIQTSYAVSPLGPGISPWRVLFVFENWPSMTPAIRSAALAEIRTFAASNKGARALVDTIKNPAGRLAAKLAIRRPYSAPATTRRYANPTRS